MTPLPEEQQPDQPAQPPEPASEPSAETADPTAPTRQPSQAAEGIPSPAEASQPSPETSQSSSEASLQRVAALSGWLGDGGNLGDCLTAEEVAELNRDWDPADAEWYAEDPDCGPPELPASEWAQLQADDDRRSEPVAEVFDAGFNRLPGGRSGTGFAAGGPLDLMLPGSELAWHVGQARRDLAGLDDNQLVGLMISGQKLEAWAAEVKLGAASELTARRIARDGEDGQKVSEEIGAALTKTARSADLEAAVAAELERLPQTKALLANGIIDMPRVKVITRSTSPLTDQDAAQVDDVIARRAGDLNTGRLTSACDSAVKSVDPAAARRRKQQALRNARVEAWAEPDGTAALAGRDLPPALVIAADKNLDADAAWLRGHGAEGGRDELRAMAYLCRLNRQPLATLLPQPATASPADRPTPGTPPGSPAAATSTPPGSPGTSTPAGSPAASPATGTPAGSPAQPMTDPGNGTSTGAQAGPALGGTVNLTMPWSAFQGRSDRPGEVAGFGAAAADTCRDLARRMTAAGTATRWCITLTDQHGRATGHGCARAGPGPPGSNPLSWLASVTIHKIETTACAHQRQSASYQPSPSLRHLIKTRSRRCGYPGCGRPATGCDDDHTLAYHLGGRTCECNLYPLCRRHHRAKQAPGWHLDQPQPGHLIWTLPSGRRYTSTTEPYPI